MSPIINFSVLIVLASAIVVSALGPAPVNLGTAANFVVLSKAGVSTVPFSALTGNVGTSPVSSTALTGFSLVRSASGTFATSSQVTGQVFAADYISPTPSMLTTAVSDMQNAFNNASGRINPNFLNLGAGEIGSLVLTPGLYKWTTGVTVSTDVFLSGGPTDTWIFQIANTLKLATGARIVLSGGAVANNIVWAVSSAVTNGVASHFEGTILGFTGVTLDTFSSGNGRILAQTAVALQKATVVIPSA